VAFLLRHNLTEDAIAAQAMALRLPELNLIDRRLERALVSRMAVERDIEHHRAAGSWQTPMGFPQIVDATAVSISPAPPVDQAEHPQ
jgi:hypothetical protein